MQKYFIAAVCTFFLTVSFGAGAALVDNGQVQDLIVDPVDDIPLPGAIYRAVADRPLKGQGGMILACDVTETYCNIAYGSNGESGWVNMATMGGLAT